jgi:hypothetical protein
VEEEIASNGCFDIAVWDGVRVKGGMGDGVWFPWQLSMRFLSGEVLSIASALPFPCHIFFLAK